MERTMSSKKRFGPEFWLSNIAYVAIVIFIIFFGIAKPQFLTPKNIISIFTQSSILLLVSCGLSLTMLTKGIDMSVAGTILLSSAAMWKTFDLGMPAPVVIVVGVAVGMLIGLVNGLIAAHLRIYPMLPTMAVMYVAKGIGLAALGGGPRSMPSSWGVIAQEKIGNVPVHVFVTIAMAILLQFFLSRTPFGRHIYAVGDNEKTARERGINVNGVKIAVYTLSGLFCAFAAFISTAQVMAATPSAGASMDFHSIIAAVLGGVSLSGGKGKVFPGVVVGALIMSIISNVLVLVEAAPNMYNVVYAIVIFVVVLLDAVKVRVRNNK